MLSTILVAVASACFVGTGLAASVEKLRLQEGMRAPMCAAAEFEDVDASFLHAAEPGFAIFPCEHGPETATQLGAANIAVLHHVGASGARKAWSDAVSGTSGVEVKFSASDALVVVMPSDIVAALPAMTKYTPLHTSPLKAVERDARLSSIADKNGIKDPIIEEMLSMVTAASLLDDLDYLTGVTSDIKSRNSIHPDGLKAAQWIQGEFKKYGFDAELEDFNNGLYNPNVIATLKGNAEPDVIVVVGAHYDSRGRASTSSTDPAPGANDDGSGTAALLQLARIIFEQGVSFKYTLVIGAWGGEEQGLVGSRAYAQKCKARGDNILAMLQADMIAYRAEREGIQCGFPTRYNDVLLTDLAISTMSLYTPEVETCTTSVCCSDHQSFYEQGFAATQFFERCGSIADPQYHNAGDVVKRDGFDIEGQLLSLSRAFISTALTVLEIIG